MASFTKKILILDAQTGEAVPNASIYINGMVNGVADSKGYITISGVTGQKIGASGAEYYFTETPIEDIIDYIALTPKKTSTAPAIINSYSFTKKANLGIIILVAALVAAGIYFAIKTKTIKI